MAFLSSTSMRGQFNPSSKLNLTGKVSASLPVEDLTSISSQKSSKMMEKRTNITIHSRFAMMLLKLWSKVSSPWHLVTPRRWLKSQDRLELSLKRRRKSWQPCRKKSKRRSQPMLPPLSTTRSRRKKRRWGSNWKSKTRWSSQRNRKTCSMSSTAKIWK